MPISLSELLAEHTMPSAPQLVNPLADDVRQCVACGHRCRIAEGKQGVCRVRFNRGGEIRVPAGYVAAIAVDPIEKKPFYHVYPGRDALSFGMLGCDFHCGYCQNWVTSQALRDEEATAAPIVVSGDRLVDLSLEHKTPVMVSTYNEPLITADWAVEVFKAARRRGIMCGFVSNGNATPEVLKFIRPYVDLYKVDLKSFDDGHYRKLGGTLQNVLDSIDRLHNMGFWVEIVTLVVPGFNDSEHELSQIAHFLAQVSVDIPWHITAFHPDYKMTDPPATPAETLIRGYEIGKAAGLHFVYPGNMPGLTGDREDTRCPSCHALLIRRIGFRVLENHMDGACCSQCGLQVPGTWEAQPPRASESRRHPLPIRV